MHTVDGPLMGTPTDTFTVLYVLYIYIFQVLWISGDVGPISTYPGHLLHLFSAFRLALYLLFLSGNIIPLRGLACDPVLSGNRVNL
jgi:hypothetical protein